MNWCEFRIHICGFSGECIWISDSEFVTVVYSLNLSLVSEPMVLGCILKLDSELAECIFPLELVVGITKKNFRPLAQC